MTNLKIRYSDESKVNVLSISDDRGYLLTLLIDQVSKLDCKLSEAGRIIDFFSKEGFKQALREARFLGIIPSSMVK